MRFWKYLSLILLTLLLATYVIAARSEYFPHASITTAVIGTGTITTADINGGAIDGTIIGGAVPAAGTFTTGTIATADVNGGAIDGTIIGGTTPAAGSFTTADINDGTVEAVIGATTPKAGSFTTLSSSGAATFGSVASTGVVTTTDINGGTIDGVTIGVTTPSSGAFTTLQASSGFCDADGDTKVQVEESADEDKVRIDTGGVERVLVDASGVKGTNGFIVGSNYLIGGDGTSGRVLRSTRLTIGDATVAGKIKCQLVNNWNGDVIAITDNIGKNETVGNFSLDGTGSAVTIEASGLTGNCVGVVAASIYSNAGGTGICVGGYAVGNDAELKITNATTGADVDLTVTVDTGITYVSVTYLTDA